MDINKAADALQNALEQLRDDDDGWNPTEIRVLPSGDDMDHIKIWLNFPDNDDSLEELRQAAHDALMEHHEDIMEEFEIEIRADAD